MGYKVQVTLIYVYARKAHNIEAKLVQVVEGKKKQ